MADHLQNKRPREDMADRVQNKRPREEDEENVMSGPPPNIAANPSEVLTDLHDEKQPEQKQDSSSITFCHPLRLREMGKIRKLPNIYRDYHVHTFGSANMGKINFTVVGLDMILVVHSHRKFELFRRHGGQISPVNHMGSSFRMKFRLWGRIKSVCYNQYNNSFLIVHAFHDPELRRSYNAEIKSLEIASLEAGRPKIRRVFPGESSIVKWDFDIPLCRAMIHNEKDRKYKFFELKEYSVLFTIPDVGLVLRNLSPGNMDMVMYDEKPMHEEHPSRITLRIYSKLNGELQKEIFLPRRSQEMIDFVVLCGSNTLAMQHYRSKMEVVEICSENPISIKRRNTNIKAAYEPYYLHKRSQFICFTESETMHVCNLQGEILVTLEDHPLADHREFLGCSYICNSQDIIISLCRRPSPSRLQWIYSVNVSSIVTGECLLKISADDPDISQIRKALLNSGVSAFAYVESAFGYDERTHEFFTGNQRGICGFWSNKFHNDVGHVSG